MCVTLRCGHLYSSPVPSCDRLGLSLSTRYTVTRLPQGTIFRVFLTFLKLHNLLLFGYETGEYRYLWLPFNVMLHASPALHKLTNNKMWKYATISKAILPRKITWKRWWSPLNHILGHRSEVPKWSTSTPHPSGPALPFWQSVNYRGYHYVFINSSSCSLEIVVTFPWSVRRRGWDCTRTCTSQPGSALSQPLWSALKMCSSADCPQAW